MNEVVLAKVQTVQRCVRRAREERAAADAAFATDYSRQDAAVMNIVRAVESCIDLANYILRARKLGIGRNSADSFRLLAAEGLLSSDLAERMARTVGFRNVAVHAYREPDMTIVERVIASGLDDLLAACEAMRQAL